MMQQAFMRHYNMSKNPFTKSIAASDAFPSDDLSQVASRLDHLARCGGIGLITADAGAGKTFALRAWASHLNPNTTKLAYVCMTSVTDIDFYRELCSALGLCPGFKKSQMFEDIQSCIANLADERKVRVVIAIDEAQYLPSGVLKDLQMLTNFDMDSRDLCSIVLIGHPVLAQIISRQPYESLRQRLVVSYRLAGLDAAQAADYVRTRLEMCGADPDLLDAAAIESAASCAAGSIRRLNAIIVNALAIGTQQNARAIDPEMVLSAAEGMSLR